MSFGQCPHCGKERPYSWLGNFHCHDDYWNQKYSEQHVQPRISWYQPNTAGRWPTDWPVA